MPYCSLTEREVMEQLKENFLAQGDLKSQKEYNYFYEKFPSWDEHSIISSRDKLVQTSVFAFKARVMGRGENEKGKKTNAVIERVVEFSVSVCNDKLFIKMHGDEYYYCEQAGADIVEGAYAENVCQTAARKIFSEKLAEKGYVYESCVMEDWDYRARGFETYTEYEIEYDCYGEQKLIQAVAAGENFVYFTSPVPHEEVVPEKKKKSRFGVVLGIILVVVVVAAVAVGAYFYFNNK